MSRTVEEVLKEATGMPVSCTIVMDGEARTSDDFVTILAKENGDASIFYNTDALTLGMAMKMVAKCFVDAMGQLSEEERTMVQKVLGGSSAQEEAADE